MTFCETVKFVIGTLTTSVIKPEKLKNMVKADLKKALVQYAGFRLKKSKKPMENPCRQKPWMNSP